MPSHGGDAANRWPSAMTVIEIRLPRWGWKVFETLGRRAFRLCAEKPFFTQPRCEVVRGRLQHDFAG